MEESLPNYHEDHIAGKVTIHCNITIWYTKFIPFPQAMKIPAAKQQWIRNGRNLKDSALDRTKVRSKSEVIDEARTKGAKSSCCLTDGHLSFEECKLETNNQKYKGRVVLRGDIVKEDSGSYAVFTEQGSTASQMTAAKVMDIIPRLPGCAGQAADAVSAYTQVKMEDAPNYWKFQSRNVEDIWIRLPRHTWPKSWSSMEDPVVPLE